MQNIIVMVKDTFHKKDRHKLTEAEAEEYTMEKVLNAPVYPAEP